MAVATDKNRVSTYISDDLKKKAEELAKAEGRSLSNYIEQLIKRAVEDAEGLKPEWTFQDRLPPASSDDDANVAF
jgi:hypothetical protein